MDSENWKEKYQFHNWDDLDPNVRPIPGMEQPLADEDIAYLKTKDIEFLVRLKDGSCGSIWRASVIKPDESGNPVKYIRACKVMSISAYFDKTVSEAVDKV